MEFVDEPAGDACCASAPRLNAIFGEALTVIGTLPNKRAGESCPKAGPPGTATGRSWFTGVIDGKVAAEVLRDKRIAIERAPSSR
jgi:hypothetical protein